MQVTSSTRPSSPWEGQTIYETDTDLMYVYGGSAWQQFAGGTSVGNSGLVFIKSQAVGSGVTSIGVTDAFSSTYDDYKVMYSSGTSVGAASLTFGFTGSSTGYYSSVTGTSYAGVAQSIAESNTTLFSFAGIVTPEGNSLDLTLYGPFASRRTGMQISGRVDIRGAGTAFVGGGFHNVAASYTGFTLTSSSAITGGTIYVYGYRK
jgi:hypothetical protein